MSADLSNVDPRRVAPDTTRLLVIDVQNDFCAPGGWFDAKGSALEHIDAAADRLSTFLPVARAAGVEVIFVQAIYDAIYLSEPMLERHARLNLPIEHCRTGTWGADFYKVSPLETDLIIQKHRYSAFVDTELNALLRAQKVENLILAGVTSNVCVESTARDGYMLDYHICFLSDCSATYDPAAHEATLANIRRAFGVVARADEVEGIWRGGGYLDERDEPVASAN